jgi:hypothetical protein
MVDRRPTFVNLPPLTAVSKRLPPPHSRYKEARTLLSSLPSSSPRTPLVLARASCCCLFFFSSDLYSSDARISFRGLSAGVKLAV